MMHVLVCCQQVYMDRFAFQASEVKSFSVRTYRVRMMIRAGLMEEVYRSTRDACGHMLSALLH